MKHPDPEMISVKQSEAVEQKAVGASPEGLIEKDQADNPEAAFPQGQTKLEEGRADLWRAVRTVVKSQRQAPLIRPVSRDGEIPLSFAQQRLWFLHQLEPDNPTYNMSIARRITGPLNVAALEQSLGEIVRRHEALRTNFATVEGQPVQVIASAPTFTLQVGDLRELPESEREDPALRLATEETQRPFDLPQDLLLRATLLRLGEEENILVLTTHQIVFDGQSKGVLIQELMTLYEAFSAGKPSPLPALPIQYADFAHWQRQWLQGEVLEAQLSYWQEKLGPSVPLLKLPADRRRPAVQTFRGATQSFVLPESLSEELRALSQQEGVTPFVSLLAAFQSLLYCYTAQEDILVFTSTAGRNRFEIKGLIGLFANLLAMRTDLSGNPSFRQLLSRVRKVTLGAYAHQDLPFEQLVETLQPERDLSYTSLFQVIFLFLNEPRPNLELSGLTLSPLNVGNETAKFDWRLFMVDTEQELTGSLQYKTDLFDAATITRMLGYFQTLLEGIVANPDQRLSDLPLLTEAERRKLPDGNIEVEKNFVEPRDTLELQLTKIWEKILGKKPIGVKDNFFELGGHSLQAVRLFAQIEKITGKKLPLATLLQAPTVEQLASILRDEEWSLPWSSLVPIQAGGSKPPFFCVHECGGGILNYYDLARHLGKEQLFYALRAQGLDGERAPHTRIEDMAAHYIKEIRTIQPEGPYFIGGFGVGGRIAFEMAQQLGTQGQKVGLLVLMDSGPPQANSSGSNPPGSRKTLSYYVRRSVYHLQHRQLTHVIKNTLKSVLKKYHRRIGYIFMPGHIRYIQHVMDALNRASGSYVPQVYPGRITYFLAEKRRGFSGSPRTRIGTWYDLAAGGLDVRVVPGDHLGMLKEPHVRVLAEQLRSCLDEAQAYDSDANNPLLVARDDTQAGYPKVEVWSPLLSSLVPLQSGGSKPPFFCIHGCGGGILNYYDLARHMGKEQPFYVLRAQGLDKGQVPHTRIEDMAAHYIKEIRTIQPEGPYFLGGGGGGGAIAFEMAQQLTAQGQKVALLVLMDIGSPRPNSSGSNPRRSRKSLSHYVRRLVYHLQHRQLIHLLKKNLINRVLKRWRIFHIFIPSHIRRIQRVRDAQRRALWSYVPQVYPDRITYFLREEFSGSPRTRIGDWYDLAAGGLDVRVVTGNHATMWREPHVQVLAEQLRACLDEAQAEG